jgi:hypothetical protein
MAPVQRTPNWESEPFPISINETQSGIFDQLLRVYQPSGNSEITVFVYFAELRSTAEGC